MQELHNYKARPHLYPGISGDISSAFSLATCRWRLSIARAQAAARLFFKRGQEKTFGIAPAFLISSKKEKDPWNVACSFASKIHHIGPNFVFFPLTFCVSLLAGRLSCAYSFCQDDAPSLFETTFSTRQENRDFWKVFLDFTAALHQEAQKYRSYVKALLAPLLSPSKKSGSGVVSVCLLPLLAAVQCDWLGEVREAKRRLLLTLWWQTGKKSGWIVWSWMAAVLVAQKSAEAVNQPSLTVKHSQNKQPRALVGAWVGV